MNIITVNNENIDKEHICCAITDEKGEWCVSSKKAWLKERFKEGLVFKKADVRGKAFIEYIPGENAWSPIEAEGYMFINCLWVAGQYKGQGISNELLQGCISDAKAKGKKGLAILSSKKKLPYLADPKYLRYKGFQIADEIGESFKLYYLPFEAEHIKPSFKPCAKVGTVSQGGIVIYYSNQCPFTEKYIGIIKEIAAERNVEVNIIKVETKEAAQNSPSPWTTFSLFYDGKFVSHEILSDKSFIKFLETKYKGDSLV